MLTKVFIEKMIYLIKFFKFFFIFFIFLNYNLIASSTENKIIYKIDNEIITSFDITREFRYLALINPNIINLKKAEIFEISKNSLIREKIKKIEILNHTSSLSLNEDFFNQLLTENYTKLGLNNLKELEKKLYSIGFSLDEFKNKLAIEALWNQLVYEKYFTKVKIDKDKLKNEISRKSRQLVYNLSEIVFNAENKKDFEDKFKNIEREIETNGFENAALLHSISDSKSLGGNLGWINETSINKNLNIKIKNLKIGEFTKPEVIPGGFLIIKLNNVEEKKISINKDLELKKLITLKTNQQLNRFSNIYFKKIKKNIKIEKI